ncbi:rta1 domain protein [Diplodia corticola]|uniref:Rta1 domain protein n=1 Tax=Diplodia corticola TaxID=236234 RepID=A0A1J9QTZ3_9PEZI|nr:rta1 domain protein [Diplodia corticola]OJD31920.1 rta1 domain protein [Diplodia corticola]
MSGYAQGSLWYYAPSKAAPVVFIILFLVSGLVHLYQCFRYKSWRITLFLPWAALIMSAGFATRLAGAYHFDNLSFVIASTVLVMSGPPVYAASNYLVFSRLLFYVPYLSPMHPGRVLTTFLGLDALIEILISNGAVRISNASLTDAERNVGDIMVKVSLITQALIFFALVGLAIQFHIRARRAGVLTPKLRTVLIVLYTTSAAVSIRCIYRIVEYFEGYSGMLFTHEYFFYIFEAALMFLTTLILNIWHPGARMPRSNKLYLSQDGVTELRGLGWGDNRNWVITVFDPFDLVGLCRGNDKRTRFWEMTPEEIATLEAEQKRNKRSGWKVALDPFNFHGKNGAISKRAGKHGTGGGTENKEGTLGVERAVSPKRDVGDAV